MAKIAPYVFIQELDDNGDPIEGGLLYTYEAGTSTPKATYTDASETTANSNPIVLDAAGRASVWLETGVYKFVLKDSADVLIKEVDNITGEASNAFGEGVELINTNTIITDTYRNNVLQCTGAITLTLDAVATAGEGFVFTVKNSSSGDVTIDPDASELIDGQATIAIGAGKSSMIVCTGTAWISVFLETGVDDLPSMGAFPSATLDFIPIHDTNIGGDFKITPQNFYKSITGLTEDAAPDTSADYMVMYDSSTASAKKVKVSSTLLDDDTFATASATKAPSSESVLALVNNKFKLETELTTTAGTSFDFTGLPDTVNQINICFDEVSLSGSDHIIIQIGDSGGIENTGYTSTSGIFNSSGGIFLTNSTAGFVIHSSGSDNIAGFATLTRMSRNKWVFSHSLALGNSRVITGGGVKGISSVLDRLRITRTGSNTFDNGAVNISYQ